MFPFPSPLLTVAGGAPAFVETAYVGYYESIRSVGGYGAGQDFKSAVPVTIPSGGVWAKRLVVNVTDTSASSSGTIKGLVYSGQTSAATKVKEGIEIAPGLITDGTTELDLWFNSDHSAIFLAAGSYLIGIITGSANWHINRQAGTPTLWNADTYSDGATDPYGSQSSSATGPMNIKLPYSVAGP